MEDNEILEYALANCNANDILEMYDTICQNSSLDTLQLLFNSILNRVVVNNDDIVNIDSYNRLLTELDNRTCQGQTIQIGGNVNNIQELKDNVNNIEVLRANLTNKYVNIVGTKEKAASKKFRYKRFQTKFEVNAIPEDADPIEWIENAINEILKQTRDLIPENARVGFSMQNSNENNSKVFVSWRRKAQLDSELILSCIGRIMQSNASFLTEGEMIAQIDYVDVPQGFGSRKRRCGMKIEQFVHDKTSFIAIKNTNDHLCLARAIVTAKAHYEYKNNTLERCIWSNIRQGRSRQTDLAIELCKNSLVDLKNGATLLEIEKIQEFLKEEFCIVVYYAWGRGRNVMFNGINNAPYKPKLNLLYENNHFDVITNVKGAFGWSYFCETCFSAFSNKFQLQTHKCPSKCEHCKFDSTDCHLDTNIIHCDECLRDFNGKICYENHLSKIYKEKDSDKLISLCNQMKKCKICLRIVMHEKTSTHVCDETYCKICACYMPYDHQCFMQPYVSKYKPDSKYIYVFYDLECTQDKLVREQTFEHEPNLCVVQTSCYKCINNEDITVKCDACGEREKVFTEEPVKQLVDLLLSKEYQNNFKYMRVIAHNQKGYDGHFVLKHLVKETICPDVIMQGNSIISMKIPETNVHFIDSLSYFVMPLSAMTKAFGLPAHLSKSYFPHFFNTKENKHYVGPYPEAKYYGSDTMKSNERTEFLKWHNEKVQNNDIFDMQVEIVKYCKMDVTVLRLACLKFRDDFLKANNIEPFLDSMTISSAAMAVFRQNYLQPGMIGIMPKNGYRYCNNQSRGAIQWMLYEERQRGIKIQHAGRDREKHLPGCGKVDGYYESDGKKIAFQYQGCWYHGHTCLPGGRDIPIADDPSDTLNERRRRTLLLNQRIIDRGYELVEMNECSFKIMKKHDPEMAAYVENHPMVIQEPLNIRDSFYGGRVNCSKLYHLADVRNGEVIYYKDFTSLYGTVNKYDKYPIGHPISVRVGDSECQGFECLNGFVKLKILPPQDLFHPVLPFRVNGRLMFSLCRSCAQQENQNDCEHDEEDRAIIGTYVIDEVVLAISKGYRVIECYEVLEYNVTQFDPATGLGGIFAQFVNNFLRLKQMASGFPRPDMTDTEKLEYIKNYKLNEGIELLLEMIEFNPSLRALAKLLLCGLWGKFGEKNSKNQTIYIRDENELFKMLLDPSIEVYFIEQASDEIFLVQWKHVEEVYVPTPTVNIAIAAYTTSFAKMRLYDVLDKLGDRVLYYDTDAAMWWGKPGMYVPPNGEYLGQLTDEVSCYGENSFIFEFVSCGPKNYSYKVAVGGDMNNVKTVCKVKGLTLNYKNSQLVNFDSLKLKVLKNDAPTVLKNSSKICRLKNHTIISRPESKIHQLVIRKRRVIDNYCTVPYGFAKKPRL